MTRTPSSLRLLPALTLALAIGGLSAAPAEAQYVRSRIQGTATDGRGVPVLDVAVKAVNDSTGEVTASALSYDNLDGDQPGYFWLDVHRGPTFTVTLAKDGFESVTLDDLRVTRRHRTLSLGEVALRRLTTTKAIKPETVLRVGNNVKIDVEVSGRKPTGKVVVKEDGEVLGSEVLSGADRGEVTVNAGTLRKGDHTLKVVYAGSDVFAGSFDKVSVTVKGKKRNNRATNALLGS